MAVTPDQLSLQIMGAIQALENISAKERGEVPHKEFGENYNNLRALAQEAMPNADVRRWPPAVQINAQTLGQSSTESRYVEIHAYMKQILAILNEGIDMAAGWGTVG